MYYNNLFEMRFGYQYVNKTMRFLKQLPFAPVVRTWLVTDFLDASQSHQSGWIFHQNRATHHHVKLLLDKCNV